MSANTAALDEMIGRLVALGENASAAVAREAAPAVEAVSKASASAGQTPDGVAWEPRRDGRRALANAVAAVECLAVSGKVVVRLVGTSTGNQRVQAIQNVVRPIIPARGAVSAAIGEALTAAGQRYFARSMGR